MELDDLKKIWNETPIPNKTNPKIMDFIQHKSYGPLAQLKRTYRKQIVLMTVVPLLLLASNLNNVDKTLTSVLFWFYVAFCIGMAFFARYNYRIVERMQTMDLMVKTNLEQQVELLQKRAQLEILTLRFVTIFFILLLEVLPYFQDYSMLNKWHSLSPFIRFGAYIGLLLLQYVMNRRVKEYKVGRHLTYLKQLAKEMQ